MAKHIVSVKNGNGGLFWISRPASKMNNKELDMLGANIKRFAKRHTSKKRRSYLKSEISD